jgi:hypothetical protein
MGFLIGVGAGRDRPDRLVTNGAYHAIESTGRQTADGAAFPCQ